ncbi:MAG: cyclic nucleotide-binding domain-containing protein [Acidobacteriia bacterium]|nr:cyclic nucleotide-binding domain-containing protein [Terriglobia bacterium]
MESLEPILAQHSFFEGLDAEYLKLFVGCASNVRYYVGAYLFRTGEDASQFYLIRQGRVALEIYAPQRPPIVVQTLEAGDILGWSWLIPPHRWRFDARVVEGIRAIALDGKCLRTKCEENHDLGYELLKRFVRITTQRLEATRLQLLDVYAPHV